MNENDEYKNINIDSIDISDDSDYTEEVTQGDEKKGSKFFKGSGGPPKGILKWIIIAIISIAVIVGLIFGGKSILGNKNSSKTDTTTQTASDNDNAKNLFKESIKNAVDAQSNKHNINLKWREATTEYGQSGNIESFKEKLSEINDERIADFEKIPSDSSSLNKLVIESLNNMRDYMNKAFNANDTQSAIDIYNEWNVSDKEYDAKYIAELKKLLSDNKIKIKSETTDDDGSTTIEY